MCFLPQDAKARDFATASLERFIAAEGQRLIGWRDVPVDTTGLGTRVIEAMPVIRQAILAASDAIRDQVASAIDLVVQQARMRDGSRRIVAISEVEGMEGDVITLQDLFTFDYGAGRDETGRFRGGLISTGLRPKFTETLHDQGIDLPSSMFLRGLG